jgi:hypothetical protein
LIRVGAGFPKRSRPAQIPERHSIQSEATVL